MFSRFARRTGSSSCPSPRELNLSRNPHSWHCKTTAEMRPARALPLMISCTPLPQQLKPRVGDGHAWKTLFLSVNGKLNDGQDVRQGTQKGMGMSITHVSTTVHTRTGRDEAPHHQETDNLKLVHKPSLLRREPSRRANVGTTVCAHKLGELRLRLDSIHAAVRLVS